MAEPHWLESAWPYPFWIAHRGAGKLAPENTLAAFRVGAGHGFRMFECDVKLSADGVPFLLHDATLERSTSGIGMASQLDWSALSRLDAGGWHSRAFAGESPPSLGHVAAWCLRNGFALNLEIKPTPGDEARTGAVVAAEAARLWAGCSTQPLLSSFSAEALRTARDAAGHLPRALLLDRLDAPDAAGAAGAPGAPGASGIDWFGTVLSLGCAAAVTRHDLMQAPVVERLHAAGLRALVYTVNEADEAERLIALQIDGIITDAVDRFSPAGGPGR